MRLRTVTAVLLFGCSLAILAGCGGGSSTGATGSGGSSGSSSATVQGQIVRQQRADATPAVLVVFERALGVGVAEAADPLTVRLINTGTNQEVKSTRTDANGSFTFFDVPPGSYTIRVDGFVVVSPPDITVGAGDTGIVTGNATANTATLTATVVATNFENPFQNDAQLGHAVNIARAGSCDLDHVVELRQSKMGWGQVARACNASPGVIGLGRGNLSDGDLSDAREHGGGKGNKGGKKG
jgi:Carboxypeptidase regulatory-like domain